MSRSNASSKAITNSTMSRESAPRSSTNDAVLSTCASSTPNCSTMICFTFCSTDMNPPESPSKLIDSSDDRDVTQLKTAHLGDATLKMMRRTILFLLVLPFLSPANGQTSEARRVVVDGLQREAGRFIATAPHIQGREALMQTHAPKIQRQVVSGY